MRFAIFSFVFAILALSTSALVLPLKSIVVSYPESTPDGIMKEAKTALKAAGGIITHEYKLFKGFAAKANVKAINTIQVLGEQYNAVVEEDRTVSISDGGQ